MLNKIVLLFLLIAIVSSNCLVSQNCGTTMSQEQLQWLEHYKKNIAPNFKRGDEVIYVPVVFHIVGNDEGSVANDVNGKEMLRVLCELNVNYLNNTSGLQFFISEEEGIRYHYDSQVNRHDIISETPEAQAQFDYVIDFFNEVRVDDVVNIFVVSAVPGICGYFINEPYGDCVVLVRGCIQSEGTTTTHELGHYFSLPHTFSGWEYYDSGPPPENTWESADRDGPDKNCHYNGDGFCDTPPDYFDYRWSCGSGRTSIDQYGVEFKPDSSFFMSYASDDCVDRFSDEQVDAMQANLLFQREGHLEYDQILNLDPLVPSAMNYPTAGDSLVPNQDILFKWESAGNAQYIFRLSSSGSSDYKFETITTETEYFINSLEPNKKYNWSVTPFNDGNFCIKADSTNDFWTTRDIAIRLAALNVVSPVCYGDANGSVSMEFEGGTPPYLYLWEDGFVGNERSDLAPGDYKINVVDALEADEEVIVSVSQPEELNILIQQEGDALIAYSNDVAFNLDFVWSDGSITSKINNIEQGDEYTVTVTNLNGCQFTTSFQTLGVNAIVTDVTCNGEKDGVIEIEEILGDSGEYSFEWNNTDSLMIIDSLRAGKYQLKIFNENNEDFKAVFRYRVWEPEELDVEAVLDGLNAGVVIEGGVPPYSITWYQDEDTIYNDVASNFTVGGHSVLVEDANGCIFEERFFVLPLAVQFEKIDVSCEGSSNGYVFINTPNWGGEPYSYIWEDGYEGQERFDVVDGLYKVKILDGVENWEADLKIEVLQLESDLKAQVEQVGNLVTSKPSGGEAPYTFEWADGSTESTNENLEPGQNLLTVTDANGCAIEEVVTFIHLDYEVSNVQCLGEYSGSIEIEKPTGGNAPYVYIWQDGSTGNKLEELPEGEFELTIRDIDGVEVKYLIEVREPVADLTAYTEYNDDGSVSCIAEGGWGNYEYRWFNGEKTASISGLESDEEYYVRVTDDEGCRYKHEFTYINLGIGSIANISEINVFPNPIGLGQNLNVDLRNIDPQQKITIDIYSETGKLMKSFNEISQSQGNFEIDLQQIPAGIYFINFGIGSETIAKKILVY